MNKPAIIDTNQYNISELRPDTLAFHWIKPGELRSVWAMIKPGIDKVARTTDAWITEDIYVAIKTGAVNLHVVYQDGEYKGLTVTQQQDSYGEVTLHVWAAYSQGHDFNILEQSVEQFKEWGKAVNAKKITFSTNRKGWAKQALKLGYKPTLTTYELKL